MTNLNAMCSARRLAAVVFALLLAASPLEAQLAHASATSLALAGNNTASVRGFGAISVNPAGLGMPGSDFSLAIIPVQIRAGLSPIKLGDLVDYEGQVVPAAIKEEWLTKVAAAGGESGMIGADASAFALSIGNFGFQISTVASADVNLPTGMVEGLLFGNAGRTGSATDLSLVDASIATFAMTTVGFSVALPVSPLLSFGMTGKYSYGHALAVGRSRSGSFEADPIGATLDFPMVTSCQDEIECVQDYGNGGTGFGLDIGAVIDLEVVTLGASIQNIVSNFGWDETKLGFRPGTILFEDGELESMYDEMPYADAPADLKAMVDDFTLKPAVSIGAAMALTPTLTLTGDIHGRLADEGIALQPNYSTGVGAQLDLGILELLAGLTKISNGMQYGIGGTLVLGPVNLSLAGGLRKGVLSDTVMSQFGLSFGAN